MDEKIELQELNEVNNKEVEPLIKLLKDKKISDISIMLTILGIGTHTEYYDVLINRINNVKEPITDSIVKELAIEIFHEIDKNDIDED